MLSMITFNRRMVLLGAAASGVAAAETWPSLLRSEAAQPLRIPELIDARTTGGAISLTAQAGQRSFFPGQHSSTQGFNGDHLGPTLRVHRSDEVELAVSNALSESTAVHWHGLLAPAEADGGPQQMIAPGGTWRPRVRIDQPAATLWYHAHVHGRTARQVYNGLAGMIIVADEAEKALGLPSDYGVNDLPLILQDKVFEDGRLIYPDHPMTMMRGLRGDVVLVNGTVRPVTRVPASLVRLRFVNASNARVYDLWFADKRSFHRIASDAGLLERPVEESSLHLAPGERAEILVDFSDGRATSLRTGADSTLSGMGMMMGMRDPLDLTARLLHFEPQGVANSLAVVPDRLVQQDRVDPTQAVRRRQLTLTMGMGGMMGRGMSRGERMERQSEQMGNHARIMAMFGINGRSFDMQRIDQTVRLGDTEIWEISSGMMPHPFHIHGVHFEVLSRGNEDRSVADQGLKDTVLVHEPIELLMRFTQPAAKAAFLYHCHILEHEDGGMMGQYRTA